LKGVPSLGRNSESSEIAEIGAFFSPATKDIHHIVDQGSRVPLARSWDVADAVHLGPEISFWIISPDIVEPSGAVRASEQVHTIVMADHGMISPRRGSHSSDVLFFGAVGHQEFPLIGGILQGIQVERQQVIEEVALDLTTKYVDLGTEYVQSVAISAWRSRSGWSGPRPLSGSCFESDEFVHPRCFTYRY
jgi:hypothetical protein